ncbi:hypothetical protein L7G72_09325 [Xenorhabdus bovienii]|uniref:hypothetical protein n=1 Tax=Xenorhabdus bovienii TaxID=40576 RepID=UPI001EE02BC4|nr:hypothetical protein [Xenorhabdus bovienii]MCG3462048.1 hypothetical protein [Xenorhabdus bovienii]
MKNRKNIIFSTIVIIAIGLFPLYFLFEFTIVFGKRNIPIEIEKWGYFGSFFSGIFTLLSISILLYTLMITNHNHREEIELLSEDKKINNFNMMLDSLVYWMEKNFRNENETPRNIEIKIKRLRSWVKRCNGSGRATPWQACRHYGIGNLFNDHRFNEVVPLVKALISIAKSSKTDIKVFKALLATKISKYECFSIALAGYDNDGEFPYIVTGWEMFENHPFEELEQVITLDDKKGQGGLFDGPKVSPENSNNQ